MATLRRTTTLDSDIWGAIRQKRSEEIPIPARKVAPTHLPHGTVIGLATSPPRRRAGTGRKTHERRSSIAGGSPKEVLTHDEILKLSHNGDEDPELASSIASAQYGIERCFSPELVEEGVGGAYFMLDGNGVPCGVFKPRDEEACSVNNPKNNRSHDAYSESETSSDEPQLRSPPLSPRSAQSVPILMHSTKNPTSPGMKKGIPIGSTPVRECAAYLLDHGHLAGVPPTELIACSPNAFSHLHNRLSPDAKGDERRNTVASRPLSVSVDETMLSQRAERAGSLPVPPVRTAKVGSFQVYRPHDMASWDVSPSCFNVEELHHIAILDVRLFNTDRHGGNMLVKRNTDDGSLHLIPIDHSYVLPEYPELSEAYFEWTYWPQAAAPLSPASVNYIASLNADHDVMTLERRLGDRLTPGMEKTLRISLLLLQSAAAAGLTLRQTAEVMCRNGSDMPSPLENACEAAESAVRRKAPEIRCDGTFGAPPRCAIYYDLLAAELQKAFAAIQVSDARRRLQW